MTVSEENQDITVLGNQNFYQRLLGWANSNVYRVYRGSMLQHIMECLRYFFQEVILTTKSKPITGPNTLAELLTQFDLPKKIKTNVEIFRDYQIKETLAKLEVDMLTLEPTLFFIGHQMWQDSEDKKFYDWVPCGLRPEVLYCCCSKN
jgi:hypothetical protein